MIKQPSSRIELGFGGGSIDVLLDIASGQIELYTGGDFRRYDEQPNPNSFHSRYGGKQYYSSRSGMSGAGWIPAKPTLKKVNGYRVDVGSPWITLGGRQGYPPVLVGGKEIWVPFEYRGSNIPADWPVVVRDQDGALTFCRPDDLRNLLMGRLKTNAKEYRIKYLKSVGVSEHDFVLFVNEPAHGYGRWANVRRLVEHLHMEELAFVFPEGEEKYEGDYEFWKRLGFRRLSEGLFKVTRGICRYMVPMWDFETMKKCVPANVHPLAPHLYVQEREGQQYVGVGRFHLEGSWYDYESYLETDAAFRILAGDREEILQLERVLETGANEKMEREREDRARQELYALEEKAQEQKIRELCDRFGDLEVTLEDSIAAGNCRPGTEGFRDREFPGKNSVKVERLVRFLSVWGVRRVLEHKLLPLAANETPNS